MKFKLINWFLLILVFLLSLNIVRSIVYLSKRGAIIDEYKIKAEEEKILQEDLKRKLAQVESREFLEKEARNKLNLGKEGEIVILLPSLSPLNEPTPSPYSNKPPNWQRWLRLFI